jgi:hypothetical protein
MNLKKFNVATTNIFPATNSTNGGQLVTEFNLRSRESVYSDGTVQYMYGPSFVHGEADFAIVYADSTILESFHDTVVSAGSTLILNPGRAVLNGYYVESLAPIVIDMTTVNAERVAHGQLPLSGRLTIGLKVFFSTEDTMIGSILTEDADNMYYDGVQVVILSAENARTPMSVVTIGGREIDCGLVENQHYVNMDIKLADFDSYNSNVSNIVNNPKKCQAFPASRIGDIDELIPDIFVKKSGLDPKKLYTFAGKGTDPATGNSTWCDSTDALMIWDSNPQYTMYEPELTEAAFLVSADDRDRIQLAIPHKQVDGMTDSEGRPQYYDVQRINLPKADWGQATPGLVSKAYTNAIKANSKRITDFYQLTNGKQRAFLNELNDVKDLPEINSLWDVGDYVLVAKDSTIISDLNDTMNLTPPSTLYVVLPATVTEINNSTNTKPDGLCLGVYAVQLESIEPGEPGPHTRKDYWGLDSGDYKGVVDHDYFQLNVMNGDSYASVWYYTVKTTNGIRSYSEAMQLTGQYPFATEQMTGGFLNAPDNYIDAGYVYLDDYGHLRLRDYALLRQGVLAYQLGADRTIESGLTIDSIQAELDEYVNARVAFPNASQIASGNPNLITINITLPAEDEGENPVLEIYDLDSRFNTGVNLNIYGSATYRTTVNISDCERIKVNILGGSPTVNIYRSCLYYNANTLDSLGEIVDMSLWYSKIQSNDPTLVVEGMTVRAVADQATYDSADPEYNVVSSEYWTVDTPNDNHFMIALQSLTFGSNGEITGCDILVRNNSTANIYSGRQIFHDTFTLPQGPALYYPVSKLNQPVKVTGRFVAAYPSQSPEGYVVQETDFSLATQCYTSSRTLKSNGEVAILVNSYTLEAADPVDVGVWEPHTFHHFSGTTLL